MPFPFLKDPFIYFFSSAIFFSSCSVGGDVIPPAITTGKLAGSVTLYNERDSLLSKDSMIVSIDGSGQSALTDANGKFIFDKLPFATYNFIYSKNGFGTFKLFKFKYSADSPMAVISDQSLGQLSTTTVTSLNTTVTSDSVFISYTVDPIPVHGNNESIRLFFSTNASVSNKQYTGFSKTIKFGHSPSHTGFSKADFYSMGFTSGQTIYVRCYGDSYFSNMYADPSSDLKIFPNINETTVSAASFVLP